MSYAISVNQLNKTYSNGFEALKNINLDIKVGEIFALLGPNGAGKTTLISSICGIMRFASGRISICGYDIAKNYREARSRVGLVPQELMTDAFETVWNSVSFSRSLFGKPTNPAHIEEVLKSLSLWEKKDTELRKLSGGMRRRVMIAKALSHEPEVLFLDEPSAGVDVELRKSMWAQVRALRQTGVTIILTTHYIEEAEEMADRIGVINNGQLMLVENKHSLMSQFGKKELILDLHCALLAIPQNLSNYNLNLATNGTQIIFTYDTKKEDNGVANLLASLQSNGIHCKDIHTRQSTLEEIFVDLVGAA
tara:strand:+ start:50755 stop:51678 length:924 start_codon:yes stop_codon:yes gene_type:complete